MKQFSTLDTNHKILIDQTVVESPHRVGYQLQTEEQIPVLAVRGANDVKSA